MQLKAVFLCPAADVHFLMLVTTDLAQELSKPCGGMVHLVQCSSTAKHVRGVNVYSQLPSPLQLPPLLDVFQKNLMIQTNFRTSLMSTSHQLDQM